jgi:probable F420-dependent oxidoreductase
MSTAQFGVRIPVAGVLSNPAAIKKTAIEADKMGFDTLWVHDYLIWNQQLDRVHISCGSRDAVEKAGPDYPPIFYESLTSLAYCASVTDNIRLGVALLILPYRDVLFTAKQIACIDSLSDGRLDLGLGQGAAKSTLNVDFEVLGISRRDKVERTRDYFEAMRKVWTEDSPSYHGPYVNFDDATIWPKPVQKPYPPIWLGGFAENSLKMIADYATGWLSFWVTPDQFPKAIDTLHERLRGVGRDPRELTIGTEIQIMLADTTENARRMAEPTMRAFEEGYAGTTGGFADDQNATDSLSEIWASSLVGSTEEVREQVHRFVDAGCTYFELKFIYHDIDHLLQQWRTFADHIMPDFK